MEMVQAAIDAGATVGDGSSGLTKGDLVPDPKVADLRH